MDDTLIKKKLFVILKQKSFLIKNPLKLSTTLNIFNRRYSYLSTASLTIIDTGPRQWTMLISADAILAIRNNSAAIASKRKLIIVFVVNNFAMHSHINLLKLFPEVQLTKHLLVAIAKLKPGLHIVMSSKNFNQEDSKVKFHQEIQVHFNCYISPIPNQLLIIFFTYTTAFTIKH